MANCCKYCSAQVEDLTNEGLKCEICENYVHCSCLKRGSTPGGLFGDVFFNFTCLECSDSDSEIFVRDNQRWLQVLILTFYHLTIQNKALSRKGFYHWKMHVATFIDKHWTILFGKNLTQKKNWTGTISGMLSVNSSTIFTKCVFSTEQGWWTLKYPKLTPKVTINLVNELNTLKSSLKSQQIPLKPEHDLLQEIIDSKNYNSEYTTMTVASNNELDAIESQTHIEGFPEPHQLSSSTTKRSKNKRSLLPTLESIELGMHAAPPRKRQKFEPHSEDASSSSQESSTDDQKAVENSPAKFFDPMCHYNTSINNIFMLKHMNLKTKLLGGLRDEPVLSPYTNLYLKPYIHRDTKNTPHWLKIMAQIQLKTNEKNVNYLLPPREPIDYVYVQPSHIPAINSLCNQFFWPGIDLSECLQYPDFTCVVMYKKLIVGFAFIVPDINVHENYISFILVRPGWRNIGIARFMIYHLIQTSMGKDITLHVAINNPALFLYQKFGFKVEHVELNFYEKYLRNDSFESKHAFFCRLER